VRLFVVNEANEKVYVRGSSLTRNSFSRNLGSVETFSIEGVEYKVNDVQAENVAMGCSGIIGGTIWGLLVSDVLGIWGILSFALIGYILSYSEYYKDKIKCDTFNDTKV
jgi:hypothetical protein